ncbi:MAG: HDIG domain-containing metalloprotein, partial [Candidatus Methylomirabilales bacterium]
MGRTRQEAWALLTEFTKAEGLLRHALAVESAMGTYARKFGEDEELWRIVGLLHDFDYERYPDLTDHPFRGTEILRERGWPEEIIRAILSHADHTGVPRESQMEHALFACDELTGFITAAALIRPSRSLFDLEVRSVRKRMKEKAFARNVSRDDLLQGAEEMGLPLDEHIGVVLKAMRSIAADLALAGSGPQEGRGLKMALVTISDKYQIVIPSEVRKRLGLKPKQKLIVVEKGEILHLVPDQPLARLRGVLRCM